MVLFFFLSVAAVAVDIIVVLFAVATFGSAVCCYCCYFIATDFIEIYILEMWELENILNDN